LIFVGEFMKVVQTALTKKTETGVAHLIAWLPVDPRVKRGSVISLDKDDGNRWVVERQYAVQDSAEIQRGWGVDLPKSQRTER
jgi:hypothetical protein